MPRSRRPGREGRERPEPTGRPIRRPSTSASFLNCLRRSGAGLGANTRTARRASRTGQSAACLTTHVAVSIAVLEALDKPMPIRMASAIGRTEGAWRCGACACRVPTCRDGGSCSNGGLRRSRARRVEVAPDCARADMSFCRVLSSQPRSRVTGKPFPVLSVFSGVPIATEQKTTIFQGGRSGERSLRRTGGSSKASFMSHPMR